MGMGEEGKIRDRLEKNKRGEETQRGEKKKRKNLEAREFEGEPNQVKGL
jgi:hypothetical protein